MEGYHYSLPHSSLLPEGKLASLCAFITLLFTPLRRNSRHSRKKLPVLSLFETGQARYRPRKPPKLRPIKLAKALLRIFFHAARCAGAPELGATCVNAP
jgi:hypothetical protein